MRLEVFIAELLYEHDCVVVPEFGGLVANYRSARLNKRTHMIYPPSKYIAFNRNLLQNDGLLIHHIASKLDLAYADAQRQIAERVADWQQQLSNNGRLSWPQIGIFFKDRQGQLQFIPEDQENFLLDAYGWTPLQLQPLVRINAEAPVEEKVIPLTPVKRSFPIARMAAAVAIPLAVGAGLLLGTQLGKDKQWNWASINPWEGSTIKAEYKPSSAFNALYGATEALTPGLVAYMKEHPEATSVKFDFTSDQPADNGIEVVLMEKKIQQIKKAALSGNFSIIAGAFLFEDNADKLVSELKAKGFSAHRAGKSKNLYLVAFGSYNSLGEARTALQEIRSRNNVSAWLKRN